MLWEKTRQTLISVLGFVLGPHYLLLDVLRLPVQKVSLGQHHKTHLFMTQQLHYLVRRSWFLLGKPSHTNMDRLKDLRVEIFICVWPREPESKAGPMPPSWISVFSKITARLELATAQSGRQWFSEETAHPCYSLTTPPTPTSPALPSLICFPFSHQFLFWLWTKFFSVACNQRTSKDKQAKS